MNGFYAKDGTCLICSYLCLTCDYIDYECKTCHGTGIGRTTNIPDCECEDGYYDDGEDDCRLCQYPCATCVTSAITCLSCVFDFESRNEPPNCNCIDGEYADVDNHC